MTMMELGHALSYHNFYDLSTEQLAFKSLNIDFPESSVSIEPKDKTSLLQTRHSLGKVKDVSVFSLTMI